MQGEYICHIWNEWVINKENMQRTSKCQQEIKEQDKNVCQNQEQISPRRDHEKYLETYEKISREDLI